MQCSSETVADTVDVDSEIEEESFTHYVMEDAEGTSQLEPWVDWIRRTTHEIEQRCSNLDIANWVEEARASKRSLAMRVAQQDSKRWSKQD